MVLEKLEALRRHIIGDRRRHARRRDKHNAVIRDEKDHVLFRGRVENLSRGGAKIQGFPTRLGPTEGQPVQIDFLLLPNDTARSAQWVTFRGRVRRIEEKEEGYALAVKFERPLDK